MSSEKQTVLGGCHCGHIRYSSEIQPNKETGVYTATRCNCTFCQKLSTTNLQVDPAGFKLLSPASLDEVANYAPRVKTIRRNFCEKCGVHVWMEGTFEANGHTMSIFAINMVSIDQPQEGIELSDVKLQYFDMLHDNFAAGLADKPYKGGLP